MSKPRGKPFQPGNTFGRGRPKGSRNRASARKLLQEHYEPLLAKQLKAAHDGDAKARQWCLEQCQRLPPPAHKLKLPPLHTLEDVERAFDVVLEAFGQAQLSVAEGFGWKSFLQERREQIEARGLEKRVERLEQSGDRQP